MNLSKKLIIIDGYSFLFRAFYSMPPLTTPTGQPIGAIYGFCSMLLRIMNEMSYSHIAVALDSGAKTFRHTLYNEYKANRSAPPDDLIPQFPEIRRAVETFNIKAIECLGYEADDIIATLVKDAEKEGFHTTIISADKDLMQLISEHTKMYDGLKNKIIGHQEVFEKFGVQPNQVRDVLALIGDASDNVPGVKGIGPKGAAELINKYGSLEKLLHSSEEIQKPKLKATLIANKALAELSYQLVSLQNELSLELSLEDLIARKPIKDVVLKLFNEFGFNSLLSRVKFDKADTSQKQIEIVENNIELHTHEEWLSLIDKILNIGKVAILYSPDKPESISFALDTQTSYIINLSDQIPILQHTQKITLMAITSEIIKIIEDEAIIKICYDLKMLCHFLYQNHHSDNIAPTSCEDIMLISYALDNGRADHGLSALVKIYLEKPTGLCFASALSALYDRLKPRLLSEQALSIYKTIDNPLSTVLYRMEKAGIQISTEGMSQLSLYFTNKITDLERRIYTFAGYELNLNSPKQLSELLFDKMAYQWSEKTSKTKTSSTSAEVLEELAAQGLELPSLILKWRKFSKLNNTYTTSLQKFADSQHRIHTTFKMCSTSTGRLSSAEPNLQNIPTRTHEGAKIRANFVAPPGKILISADYSQIELRIMASIANVDSLIDAFQENIDIHKKTASEIFALPLEEITPEHRHKAKAINFGIIYGISAYGLAHNLGISRSDAQHFIEIYFKQYPQIKDYMDNTIDFVRKNGFISTICGRKCYIPGINDKNFTTRSFAERAAINAPIQGSQADIIKKAMIKIDHDIKNRALTSRMVLQIHDELIIEAPLNEQETIINITKTAMESIIKLKVPMSVNISSGSNWGEL